MSNILTVTTIINRYPMSRVHHIRITTFSDMCSGRDYTYSYNYGLTLIMCCLRFGGKIRSRERHTHVGFHKTREVYCNMYIHINTETSTIVILICFNAITSGLQFMNSYIASCTVISALRFKLDRLILFHICRTEHYGFLFVETVYRQTNESNSIFINLNLKYFVKDK